MRVSCFQEACVRSLYADNCRSDSMQRSRLWLCVAPVAFCLLDVGLTLRGQPAEYWQGDYGTAFEGNPFFRWFLQQHPFAGLGIAVAWISVFSLAILWLPTKLARVGAFTVLFG